MIRRITTVPMCENVDQKAAEFPRCVIEASLDPLMTISSGGKITDVNEATVKATGVPRDKLIGSDFCDYFTEPVNARECCQQAFLRGFVTDCPLSIRHKDGRLTDVLYNAGVYKDTLGNVLGVVATARDITAQKQAEAEVAAKQARDKERLQDLELFHKLTLGREMKILELKKEIAELEAKVAQLQSKRK